MAGSIEARSKPCPDKVLGPEPHGWKPPLWLLVGQTLSLMAKTAPPPPVSTAALDELGLRAGDPVRFAPTARGQARLQNGTLRGSNKDGSLTITDGKGASRAIPPDRVWRSTKTKRGRLTWVPVLAGDEVQLQLFLP